MKIIINQRSYSDMDHFEYPDIFASLETSSTRRAKEHDDHHPYHSLFFILFSNRAQCEKKERQMRGLGNETPSSNAGGVALYD